MMLARKGPSTRIAELSLCVKFLGDASLPSVVSEFGCHRAKREVYTKPAALPCSKFKFMKFQLASSSYSCLDLHEQI